MAKIVKGNLELKFKVTELNQKVENLEGRLEDFEKYSLKNNILINGVPYAENENVRGTVKQLAEGSVELEPWGVVDERGSGAYTGCLEVRDRPSTG